MLACIALPTFRAIVEARSRKLGLSSADTPGDDIIHEWFRLLDRHNSGVISVQDMALWIADGGLACTRDEKPCHQHAAQIRKLEHEKQALVLSEQILKDKYAKLERDNRLLSQKNEDSTKSKDTLTPSTSTPVMGTATTVHTMGTDGIKSERKSRVSPGKSPSRDVLETFAEAQVVPLLQEVNNQWRQERASCRFSPRFPPRFPPRPAHLLSHPGWQEQQYAIFMERPKTKRRDPGCDIWICSGGKKGATDYWPSQATGAVPNGGRHVGMRKRYGKLRMRASPDPELKIYYHEFQLIYGSPESSKEDDFESCIFEVWQLPSRLQKRPKRPQKDSLFLLELLKDKSCQKADPSTDGQTKNTLSPNHGQGPPIDSLSHAAGNTTASTEQRQAPDQPSAVARFQEPTPAAALAVHQTKNALSPNHGQGPPIYSLSHAADNTTASTEQRQAPDQPSAVARFQESTPAAALAVHQEAQAQRQPVSPKHVALGADGVRSDASPFAQQQHQRQRRQQQQQQQLEGVWMPPLADMYCAVAVV
eukprot:COSAG01_NODE_10_length_42970_cov_93.010007_36_plen_534_part_00